MKRALLTIAAVAATLAAAAQTDGTEARRAEIRVAGATGRADSSVVTISPEYLHRRGRGRDGVVIHVGEYDLRLETARMSRERRGKYQGRIGNFEIGFNNFREMPNAYNGYEEPERGFMDLRVGKSISFTWNWYTFSTAITRNRAIGVTGGVGLVSNNYRFKAANPMDIIEKRLRPIESGRDLRKSKMATFAIHFPVALEFNLSRDFFISAGGWLDLVTGSHIKWRSPKQKLRRLSTNFFQAGVTARVGFHHAYMFGSYNFVEMFEQGYGPRLNPYTIGIGFGF
jgi:hypothetical protein